MKRNRRMKRWKMKEQGKKEQLARVVRGSKKKIRRQGRGNKNRKKR